MTNESVGMAYAFFYCAASKERIEAEFSNAREIAITPQNLRLELSDGVKPTVQFQITRKIHLSVIDLELNVLAEEAQNAGNNYTLLAVLPNQTNRRTAGELGDILNALYNSPLQYSFHKEEPKLIGGIVYKDSESDRYEFLE